jgi:trehalose 6-phosphate phosphatase
VETTIELSVRRSALDVDPTRMQARLEALFKAVAKADVSALCLDFDGTLAPFRVDPMSVRPWSGVADILDAIQENGRTRLALISGRPAKEVAVRLGMKRTPEIWGLHGAERRYPDGTMELEELGPEQLEALSNARSKILDAIQGEHTDFRLEEKHNSVGVHWRGVHSPDGMAASLGAAKDKMAGLLEPFRLRSGLQLLRFDGGLEIRAGRNKGDALDLLMEELPPETPVAYLGDDVTDEDAFRVLNKDSSKRSLAILVRRHWRPSDAPVWLRPPVQLRRFLRDWLVASVR